MFQWLSSLISGESLQKKLGKYLVQETIGKFLRNKIDWDQYELEFMNGSLRLSDLPLDAQMLSNHLGGAVPFSVSDAYIGSIDISVPWSGLLAEPCSLIISDLLIDLRYGNTGQSMSSPDNTADQPNPSDSPQESPMTSSLYFADNFVKHELTEPAFHDMEQIESTDGVEDLAGMIDNIFGKISVVLKNTRIHIGVESVEDVIEILCQEVSLCDHTHPQFRRSIPDILLKSVNTLNGAQKYLRVSNLKLSLLENPQQVGSPLLSIPEIWMKLGFDGISLFTSSDVAESPTTSRLDLECIAKNVLCNITSDDLQRGVYISQQLQFHQDQDACSGPLSPGVPHKPPLLIKFKALFETLQLSWKNASNEAAVNESLSCYLFNLCASKSNDLNDLQLVWESVHVENISNAQSFELISVASSTMNYSPETRTLNVNLGDLDIRLLFSQVGRLKELFSLDALPQDQRSFTPESSQKDAKDPSVSFQFSCTSFLMDLVLDNITEESIPEIHLITRAKALSGQFNRNLPSIAIVELSNLIFELKADHERTPIAELMDLKLEYRHMLELHHTEEGLAKSLHQFYRNSVDICEEPLSQSWSNVSDKDDKTQSRTSDLSVENVVDQFSSAVSRMNHVIRVSAVSFRIFGYICRPGYSLQPFLKLLAKLSKTDGPIMKLPSLGVHCHVDTLEFKALFGGSGNKSNTASIDVTLQDSDITLLTDTFMNKNVIVVDASFGKVDGMQQLNDGKVVPVIFSLFEEAGSVPLSVCYSQIEDDIIGMKEMTITTILRNVALQPPTDLAFLQQRIQELLGSIPESTPTTEKTEGHGTAFVDSHLGIKWIQFVHSADTSENAAATICCMDTIRLQSSFLVGAPTKGVELYIKQGEVFLGSGSVLKTVLVSSPHPRVLSSGTPPHVSWRRCLWRQGFCTITAFGEIDVSLRQNTLSLPRFDLSVKKGDITFESCTDSLQLLLSYFQESFSSSAKERLPDAHPAHSPPVVPAVTVETESNVNFFDDVEESAFGPQSSYNASPSMGSTGALTPIESTEDDLQFQMQEEDWINEIDATAIDDERKMSKTEAIFETMTGFTGHNYTPVIIEDYLDRIVFQNAAANVTRKKPKPLPNIMISVAQINLTITLWDGLDFTTAQLGSWTDFSNQNDFDDEMYSVADKPGSDTYQQSPNRDSNVEIRLIGFQLQFHAFDRKQAVASNDLYSLTMALKDFEVIDNMKTSSLRTFLGYARHDGDPLPRETGSSLFQFHWSCITESLDQKLEHRIKCSVLPMRMHIDQGTFSFLNQFAISAVQCLTSDECNDSATVSEPPMQDDIFFQLCEIDPIFLKIDYRPNTRVSGYMKGSPLVEVFNFVHLDGADLNLHPIRLAGVKGVKNLIAKIMAVWVPHVRSTQVSNFASGITGVKPVVQIGAAFADLMLLPIEQYRRDGRIIKGIQKGAVSFLKTTVLESAKLGSTLATRTHYLLDNVEDMISSPQYSRSYGAMRRQSSTSRTSLVGSYPTVSQPRDLKEGLQMGYSSLSAGIKSAVNTVLSIPSESNGSSSVTRALPIAVLSPMKGATSAIAKAFQGLQNTVDKTHHQRLEDKYKRK